MSAEPTPAAQRASPSPTPGRILMLLPVAAGVLILWAMGSDSAATTRPPSVGEGAAVLLIFLVTFGGLSLNLVNRLTAVALGAGACLVLGAACGFYRPTDAVSYLIARHEPLVMLAGLSLVTQLLTTSGLFDRLAWRVVQRSGGERVWIVAGLCVVTFVASLVLNNLATIMVLVPLSVRLAGPLKLDPVRLVLAEVIASNLGGASTAVGDFPNMLIADVAGIPFHSFLIHMLPVCLVLLAVLLLMLSRPAAGSGLLAGDALLPAGATGPGDSGRGVDLEAVRSELASRPGGEAIARRGLLILVAMVLGFAVGGPLGLPAGIVALVGGHLAMFAGTVHWRQLVRRETFDDVLFFSCLFVMVGAVGASQILDGLGQGLTDLTLAHPAFGVVALCGVAALMTCVFSAGPTTALLLHLMPALGTAAGDAALAGDSSTLALWALSLGVCAGSSATLTGATAGPVAAGLLEQQGHELSFQRFASTGVPVALVFLVVSCLYLVVIAP